MRCDCGHEDFVRLTECLDADLRSRNGELQNGYNRFNRIRDVDTAMIALRDDTPAGCGCFKPYDGHTVEIKRIYVRPEHRGQGIAGKMMRLLEEWAVERGNTRAVLETGKNQTEAIRLYQKAGYSRMENYGPYAGNDHSVCFSKELK